MYTNILCGFHNISSPNRAFKSYLLHWQITKVHYSLFTSDVFVKSCKKKFREPKYNLSSNYPIWNEWQTWCLKHLYFLFFFSRVMKTLDLLHCNNSSYKKEYMVIITKLLFIVTWVDLIIILQCCLFLICFIISRKSTLRD